MLNCPHCGHTASRVANVMERDWRFRGEKRTSIRRRRICKACGLSFHTAEVIEADNCKGLPGDAAESMAIEAEATGDA